MSASLTPCLSLTREPEVADLKTLRSVYESQKPYTRITPLLSCDSLSERIKGKVWIKAESLQKTGAFKFRGALYRLQQLNSDEKARGVVAYSSGNFARGLAAAGELLGISVHLVMPADAPKNKIDNARAHGAEIKLCHKTAPSREEAASVMAQQLSQQHGFTLLHPFDDPLLIQGQSAVAVELLDQLNQLNQKCDSLLCPVGGGSLAAGSSMIFSPGQTGTQVYGIEIEGFDGMRLSLEDGHLARAKGLIPSQCDALQALSPGQNNFSIVIRTGVRGLTVSERFIGQAIKLASEELKLILEPSGAIGIAALLQYPEHFKSQDVTVIATGGNIDMTLLAEILTHN